MELYQESTIHPVTLVMDLIYEFLLRYRVRLTSIFFGTEELLKRFFDFDVINNHSPIITLRKIPTPPIIKTPLCIKQLKINE